MTAYNGQDITYDEIGNPASIGNRSFTWQNGRQLASQTYNGTTWTYSYNNAGLRTSRSNGVKTYHYVYNGDKLTQMTIVDEVNHTQQVMDFTYDANGQLLTMTYGGEVYYYILSLQGDVAGITDSQGNRLIDFHYEGYGAGYYTSYDTEKAALLAQINPFGYRSYVMDLGTSMYYLQSRYYDPALGRFINADGLISTGQGLVGNNMFAYCNNNSVKFSDCHGSCPYDGTACDFRLLEAGLPPAKCKCGHAKVFKNTSIIVKNTSENDPEISARITVSVENAPELLSLNDIELSQYIRQIVYRLEYLSETGAYLNKEQAAQMYGEMQLHIIGWETRNIHPYGENCSEIEIDVINGKVEDPRTWVNIASSILGDGYQ